MITSALTNPTVKAAIEALQRGDRSGWSALFESDARLYDDGSPRSLEKFTREGVGHERFTSIDRVDDDGLSVVGRFHSDQWGTFARTFGFASRRQARSRASTSGKQSSGRRVHTVIVLGLGFVLLGLCSLVGRVLNGCRWPELDLHAGRRSARRRG